MLVQVLGQQLNNSKVKGVVDLVVRYPFFVCYNDVGDFMRLIDKTTVPQGYSVSKFLDQKGYRYNNNYIYWTSYKDNRVYILFVDDSIYTIMIMDGHRYIFEMEKGVHGVMEEFKNDVEKVAKK